MKHIQNMKTVLAGAPASVGTGSITPIEVDARGYNNARFVIAVGASTANFSVCKIQSATTSGGSFTDVSGASIASGVIDTDDSQVYAIEVDLTDRNIGQFLQIVLTEDGTGSADVSVICVLDEPNESPTTAAERGLASETFA